MPNSPVPAPELFVLAHLLAHDRSQPQWSQSTLANLVRECNRAVNQIELAFDLQKVLLTPDTKHFSLDRVAPFVEEADRPVVVAAAIAIIRRAECRTQAGEIDSRFIVAQRQSLMLVTLLWQWPMDRLNQSWERQSTLSKAITNLRQQSNPIAPALASHLELDLTPEQLNLTSTSASKTEAVKTNFEKSSTAPKPSPEVAPKSTKSKGTEPTKPRDEAPIELPTGALLDSPQIVGAIARNTTIAREDYDWTRQELEPVAKAFATLTRDLGQRAKELEKVGQGKTSVKQAAAKQMAELYEKLERTRTQDLENLRTILKCKRDAIGHFTLTMMGRTKAGKSTLFATLLGSGYEGIGTGQQRTTRENKRYELGNGVCLVDTPGIAAAGGEADEAEALKAVDGADLICYVVTSDSIQESEFAFLKKLKDKTKPLLILLNFKKDLTKSIYRKKFLKDSSYVMSPNDIEGNTQRILQYAREHYASESIVVLPVMLLAAQLARQEDDRELCSQLYRASRIQSFLDWVEGAIVNYGTLIASQTIIGETAVSLVPYRDEISAQRDQCRDRIEALTHAKQKFSQQIKEIRKDIFSQIETEISSDFQAVFNAIPGFARCYWEKGDFEQQQEWKSYLKNKLKIENKLELTIKLLYEACIQKMQYTLDEISQDLSFLEKFSGYQSNFKGQKADFDFQFFAKSATVLLTGIATIMAFFTPVGWMVGIAGAAMGIISSFLKSKKDRQHETCQKIEKALRVEVSKAKEKAINELKQQFSEIINLLSVETNTCFNSAITEFDSAKLSLDTTQSNLKAPIQTLDRSVSLRIYDWCNQNREPLHQTRLDRTIKTVQRNPGKLQIQLTQNITQPPAKQRQTECSQILGVDVQFSK